MIQWVKVLAIKPDDLTNTPEQENQFLQVVFRPPHVCCGMCTLVDTNKGKQRQVGNHGLVFLFEVIY